MATSPPIETPLHRRRASVYADEDVDRPLVQALAARGFDVLTAREAGMLRQDDDEQLAFAASQGRVIVSYNRGDFRAWHAEFVRTGRSHAGIVLLPQDSPLPRRVIRANMLLDWLMMPDESAPRIANWNDLQLRLHQGYRLPGHTEQDVRVALGQSD